MFEKRFHCFYSRQSGKFTVLISDNTPYSEGFLHNPVLEKNTFHHQQNKDKKMGEMEEINNVRN